MRQADRLPTPGIRRRKRADDKCKAYGAGNIMRVPTRLHITWDNDEHAEGRDRRRSADAAVPLRRSVRPSRTRPRATAVLQGVSVATWEYAGGRRPARGGPVPAAQSEGRSRQACGRVTCSAMASPTAANAVVTEYFNRRG